MVQGPDQLTEENSLLRHGLCFEEKIAQLKFAQITRCFLQYVHAKIF